MSYKPLPITVAKNLLYLFKVMHEAIVVNPPKTFSDARLMLHNFEIITSDDANDCKHECGNRCHREQQDQGESNQVIRCSGTEIKWVDRVHPPGGEHSDATTDGPANAADVVLCVIAMPVPTNIARDSAPAAQATSATSRRAGSFGSMEKRIDVV